jgi:integrase
VGQVLAFPPASAAPGFERAAAAFVAAHTGGPGAWAAGTARKCRETFGALGAKLPGSAADGLAALETEAGRTALARAFDAAFGELAPATYARHLSALRSAITWWRASKWLASDPTAGWARPKIPVDTTRALTRDQIYALFRLDAAIREKTLWRLTYETAARAEEMLALDVPDLDLPNKRSRVISKGGAIEWVHWRTGAAMLLPRLLAERDRGPVFLAERRPTRPVASLDLCPVTHRARLSYRRAAEIFEQSTRRLAHPNAPQDQLAELGEWTLHQLRHSQLTHQYRIRHQHPDAAGPLPTRLRTQPGAICPAGTGSRRAARRRQRPSRTTSATLTRSPWLGPKINYLAADRPVRSVNGTRVSRRFGGRPASG